jgi:hypothetical protein
MFNSGFRGRRENDGQGSINPQAQYVQTKSPQPYISGWSISGSDDTALNPAGGQTVLVNGSGFATGVSATVGGVQIGSVTLVKPTQISFTAPANSGGSYTLIVYNSSGGAAILVPGLTYSTVPTWTTAAGSIGSYYETTAINSNVVATSDSALTYTLSSGSLPTGATLYANGVITGTAPVDNSSTTYTFNITATDAELQDTTRTFTMTINVDVVTWVSPTNGTTYTTAANAAIANVSLSATDAAGYGIVYTANALPTGVSLSGNVISGTPTAGGNTTTLLTATANTTSRTATNTIYWVVQLGDSYWNLTTLALNSLPTTTPFQSDASLNNFSVTVVGDSKAAKYNPYQIGYYSNYFDGSTDLLTFTATSTFAFGTGNFTVECWVYPTAYGSSVVGPQLFGTVNGSTSGYSINLGQDINSFRIISNASGSWADNLTVATGGGPSLNVWTHMAVVRSGANLTIYKNGVSVATTASAAAWNFSGTNGVVGRFNDGTNTRDLTGYISNLRVVNSALYSTNFTPSTTPLVNVSGTGLLTCQSNRLVDASPNNLAVTKTGDTTAVPANPFTTVYDYGTTYYSTYFDGTGDYLTVASGSGPGDFPGNFTIEFWAVKTANSSTTYDAVISAQTGTTLKWILELSTIRGFIFIAVTTGNPTVANSSVTINDGLWHHWAISRSGSTTYLFKDGVALSKTTDTLGTTSITGGTTLSVGAEFDGASTFYFNGTISNLRVVKGQALYTTTFTPSTTPLTTTSQGATAANVSLLTCQSSTLIDNSTNAFAITSNGQAQPQPVSPFTTTNYTTASTTIPTLGSGYFDGTGDYLSIADSAALQFSTGNFTVECWVYEPTQTAYHNTVVGKWGSGFGTTGDWSLRTRFNNSNQYAVTLRYSGGWYDIQTSVSVSDNAWHHLAFVRDSTTSIKLYIDGVLKATQAISSSDIVGSSATMSIGGNSASATNEGASIGYISNVRIVKGTALYTANFYPGPTPLTAVTNTQLLTVQYNGGSNDSQFQDSSNYQNLITRAGNTTQGTLSPFSATGWSAYFDGNGDYLSITNAAPLRLGSGNFTVEAWIFPTSVTNTYSRAICGTYGYVGLADVGWTFNLRSDGKLSLFMGGSTGTGPTVTSTATIVANVWTHVVAVRSGSTIALYINGTQDGSTSSTKDEDYTSLPFNIGTYRSDNLSPAVGNSGVSFIGWISNLRITKGQALYTTTFTPATSPLTTTSQSATVGNVSLLTLQSPTFIDNSTNRYTITVTGDTKIQSFSPFGGVTVTPYYSNYFDGSGDYFTLPSNPAFSFGTGDFTIEMWVYISSLAAQRGLYDTVNQSDATGTGRFAMEVTTAGLLRVFTLAGTILTSGGTLAASTWYHIAYVRISNSGKLYVNGTQVNSTYTDNNNYVVGTTNRPIIGINGYDSSSYPMLGYISNLRVTKGLGIYTGAFTPPTAPLAATQSSGTNISAITQTSYSNYFDGTGDYLTIATNTTMDFSTGDFTVEAWVNPTSLASDWFIISASGSGGLFVGYAGGIGFGWGRTAVAWDYRPGVLTTNTWQHVAVTRSGTSMRIFVNGTQAGTTQTLSTAYNLGTTSTTVGSQGANYYLNGMISNLRVTKGQALYTANFTPSTTPLTTTSQSATAANVSLLTCQSSIFSDNSTNSTNGITVNGDTKISGSNPFSGSTILLTSQSSTLVDNSVNAFALTVTGDTKPTTIAPFASTTTTLVSYTTSVNGGSMYFDGTGDYLTVTNSAFATTGDFTVECWAYVSSAQNGNYGGLFSMRDSSTGYGISLTFLNTGYLEFAALPGGTYSSTAIPFNQWFHIAMIRSGSGSNNVKCFLNGTQLGTITGTATTSTNSGAAIIGRYYANGTSQYFLTGYVSNLRYVVGTALYNASFSPPTAPPTVSAATTLLANGTTGSIIDYTGKNDLETVADARLAPQNPYSGSYYSNYFTTSDYLTLPSSAAFTMGTGDFTIELWWYHTAVNTNGIFSTAQTAAGGGANGVQITGDTVYIGNSSVYTALSWTLPLNQWNHLAVVRSSGTIKTYVNGTQAASTSTVYNMAGTTAVINSQYTNAFYSNAGYASNLRVTKGQALYTTTFTPATSPLTTTSQSATAANVSLLTCQSSTFKDNSTNAFTVTRNGSPAVNSFNPFQNNGTYSMYFDGTGDYLTTPNSLGFAFGTGDFTVEAWIYSAAAFGSNGFLLLDARAAANSTAYTMGINSSGYPYVYDGTTVTAGSSGMTVGSWAYITWCRSSGTLKMFVNGTSVYSASYTSSLTGTGPLTIGAVVGGGAGYFLTGYITDLRITKYARYTTNFTPPTSTFQTK